MHVNLAVLFHMFNLEGPLSSEQPSVVKFYFHTAVYLGVHVAIHRLPLQLQPFCLLPLLLLEERLCVLNMEYVQAT